MELWIMDQFLSFFREFLQTEYKLRLERLDGDFAFMMTVVEVEPVWFADLSQGGFELAPLMTDEGAERERAITAPRALYKATSYDIEDGDLVVCYASEPFTSSLRGYAVRYVVGRSGDGVQILAHNEICTDCFGTGVRDGAPCDGESLSGSMCNGTGWFHHTGADLRSLGAPRQVQRFEEPEAKVFAHLHALD